MDLTSLIFKRLVPSSHELYEGKRNEPLARIEHRFFLKDRTSVTSTHCPRRINYIDRYGDASEMFARNIFSLGNIFSCFPYNHTLSNTHIYISRSRESLSSLEKLRMRRNIDLHLDATNKSYCSKLAVICRKEVLFSLTQ